MGGTSDRWGKKQRLSDQNREDRNAPEDVLHCNVHADMDRQLHDCPCRGRGAEGCQPVLQWEAQVQELRPGC